MKNKMIKIVITTLTTAICTIICSAEALSQNECGTLSTWMSLQKNAYSIITNKLGFSEPVALIASIDGCVYIQGEFNLIRARVTWMKSLNGIPYDTFMFFVPHTTQWEYRLLGANDSVRDEMLATRSQKWFEALNGTGRASQEFRIRFDLVNRPAPYQYEALGSSDYYKFRHLDFVRRNPSREAPDYYLEYGDKYLYRLKNISRPKLTPQGQKFVDVVGRNLQEIMEGTLLSYPARFERLERIPYLFRQYAYLTHVNVYCNAGWEKLSQKDRDTIIGDISFWDKYDPRQIIGIYSGAAITFKCGSLRDFIPNWIPDWDSLRNSWNDLIDSLL